MPEVEILAKSIQTILHRALEDGGSTIRNFQSNSGEGKAQQWHAVYDQEGKPCKLCGKPIIRVVQKMRSTFYCPSCQRPKPTTIVPLPENDSKIKKNIVRKTPKKHNVE